MNYSYKILSPNYVPWRQWCCLFLYFKMQHRKLENSLSLFFFFFCWWHLAALSGRWHDWGHVLELMILHHSIPCTTYSIIQVLYYFLHNNQRLSNWLSNPIHLHNYLLQCIVRVSFKRWNPFFPLLLKQCDLSKFVYLGWKCVKHQIAMSPAHKMRILSLFFLVIKKKLTNC